MVNSFCQLWRCLYILILHNLSAIIGNPTFVYQTSNILLSMTKSPNSGFICDIASNRSEINNILIATKPEEKTNLSTTQMNELLNLCPHTDEELYKIHGIRRKRWASIFRGIYPGTKWCGVSHSASNYSDLGYYNTTDVCCRAHDLCPDYISKFSSRSGLINWLPYPRYSCACESEFYSCLKNSTDDVSVPVGQWYFNVFQGKCFQESKEKVCLEYGWFGGCTRRGSNNTLAFVENFKF